MEQAMTLLPVQAPADSPGRHAQPPSADAKVQPYGWTSRVGGSPLLARQPSAILLTSGNEKAFRMRLRPARALSKFGDTIRSSAMH